MPSLTSLIRSAKFKLKRIPSKEVDPVKNLIGNKTEFWREAKWATNHLTRSGERPQGISIPILIKLLELIPPKSKILDVGCGHGRYSIPFAEQGHQVVATDVSEKMLELLEQVKGDLSIEVRLGDAHGLKAENGEFDVVFSNDFMGHFPDWATLLKEQARVCKKGGMILFTLALSEHSKLTQSIDGLGYDAPYSSDPKSDKPYWVEASNDELILAGKNAGLELQHLSPQKMLMDNLLLGHVLGTEAYHQMKDELNKRVKAEPLVQDFYNWLELSVFQKLPFSASNLTMIAFRKIT